MKKCNEHRDDLLMLLIVVPCAVLAAVILWIGAKDIERIQQEQEQPTYNVDSIRLIHQQLKLKTFEDSVHEFEDGF